MFHDRAKLTAVAGVGTLAGGQQRGQRPADDLVVRPLKGQPQVFKPPPEHLPHAHRQEDESG